MTDSWNANNISTDQPSGIHPSEVRKLNVEVARLTAELAAAESARCRLREALKIRSCNCKCLVHGFGCGLEEATCRKDESYICVRCVALSASGACPHEAELAAVKTERDGLAAALESAISDAHAIARHIQNGTSPWDRIGLLVTSYSLDKLTAILAARDARLLSQGRAEGLAALVEHFNVLRDKHPEHPNYSFYTRVLAELDCMAQGGENAAE